MTIWSGIGVNYGTVATYSTAQVENDFTYLKSQGVTRLRIAAPGYTNTAHIANCQDMVARALAHGFYVIWGVSTGTARPTLTATIWTAFKNYVVNTLAPWAQANGLPELALGNEADWESDGTTLTAATVRSDVRSMATTVKANGYTGTVSYSTAAVSSNRAPWISEGIGDLDFIGWNSYDTLTNFATNNTLVLSTFGSKTYITEFGSAGNGYSDFNNESAFYNDTVSRIKLMQSAGIQSGYFFCYRDGGFGVPANSFALILTNGNTRVALQAVLGVTAVFWNSFMT